MNIVLANIDTYRRGKMIAWLKARGMLSDEAEKFIKRAKW